MGVTLIMVTDIVTRGGHGGGANDGHRYCHKRRGQGGMVFIVTDAHTQFTGIRHGHL